MKDKFYFRIRTSATTIIAAPIQKIAVDTQPRMPTSKGKLIIFQYFCVHTPINTIFQLPTFCQCSIDISHCRNIEI